MPEAPKREVLTPQTPPAYGKEPPHLSHISVQARALKATPDLQEVESHIRINDLSCL